MRKTTIIVLIALTLCCAAQAAMPNPFRRMGASNGRMMPENGDFSGLTPTGKTLTYSEKRLIDFYGKSAGPFLAYGYDTLFRREYTLNSPKDRITIEVAVMGSTLGAAGLYHHHRLNIIGQGKWAPAAVGAEGMTDKGRQNRNLYFYKEKYFCKVIYSGSEPVPDLVPIARVVENKLPQGISDQRPTEFAVIDIPGVNMETLSVTAGSCFNLTFMPVAVTASAPGGGSVASDMFLVTRYRDSEAADLYRDYASYLKMFANYFEEYTVNGRTYGKAVDPNQGRVLFTVYRNLFIIAARPDGYEKGEPLIAAIMARYDQIAPPRGRR